MAIHLALIRPVAVCRIAYSCCFVKRKLQMLVL